MLLLGVFLLLTAAFVPSKQQYDSTSSSEYYEENVLEQLENQNFCTMPEDPENGAFKITATGRDYSSGDRVGSFSVLRLFCNPSYKPTPPEGAGVSICMNGKWIPEPLTCPPSCPAIYSTKTTKVTCTYKGKTHSCENPVEDTTAIIACEPLYEEPSLAQRPLRKCKGGAWDSPIPECYPVCGMKPSQGVPGIMQMQVGKQTDHPWHVGIYTADTKDNICVGSILNEKIVLSAAHCFTDLETGVKYPKESFLIAAGKYYREYNDPRDEYVQYSAIEDIRIPNRYRGSTLHYEADIAVVILRSQLSYSVAVQPICIDWGASFETYEMTEEYPGEVTGWDLGLGKEDEIELRGLRVSTVPFDQCFKELPGEFRGFLTYDKMCARFLAKNTTATECKGISGTGLAFPDINGRYYIRGIANSIPAGIDQACDTTQVVTYTLLANYMNFITFFSNP